MNRPPIGALVRRSTNAHRDVRTRIRSVATDGTGITVAIGILLVVTTTWRVGFLINDNFALANTLLALDSGHVHLVDVRYGPSHGMTPGVRYGDGVRVGRHYGMLVLALPFVWLVEGAAAIAELRIAIAAGWSLLLLAFVLRLGRSFGRRRAAAYVGSVLGLGSFVGAVAVATPLDPHWTYLLALQLQTMAAAALVGGVLYTLVADTRGRRVGVAAGFGAVLATPVGFWATIPKRHVLVGLLALLAVYAFYRARTGPDGWRRYRVASYVAVGLSAWVSPAEGLVLFAVIAPIDLLTARSNAPRELAVVGVAFGLSLLPMLVTNLAVTGHPMVPPRMLPAYHGQPLLDGALGGEAGPGGEGAGPIGSDGTSGEGGSPGGFRSRTWGRIRTLTELLVVTLAAVPDRLADLWGYTARGMAALAEPDRLVHTFVYSGYLPGIAERDGGEAVSLSVLESMPLAAPLLLTPALLATADRRVAVRGWVGSPAGQTDLLAIAYCLLLTGVYMHRLPVHATITVRYLVPAMPLAIYLLARVPAIARAVDSYPWTTIGSYATTVLVGGQLLVAVLVLLEPGQGEAVQIHARLGLLAAILLGGWTALGLTNRRDRPAAGAVLLGAAAGVTTVFLLLSSWEYFAYSGPHALSIVELLSRAIEIV